MYQEKRVFIVSAKRTAIGKFLGSLYEADTAEVCSQVLGNMLTESAVLTHDIDNVIIGNVISAGTGQGIARKISILSGIPESVPAYSVNMVCGSGMRAIMNGINEIKCGSQLIVCGGFEFMSNIPFATNSYIRSGKKFGDFTLNDLMTHDGLTDAFSGVHMGITAENIAQKYHITREMQDQYAYITQQRAIKAVDQGVFMEEIVPVKLKDYKGREYVFDVDEFLKRSSEPDKLASLKPSFLKDGSGTVTAGNTSGINDGAAFLLLASEEYCKKNNLVPLVEITESAAVGCDPQYMGLGPFYAISSLLEKTSINFESIDYFEINEAFAAQALGCYQLLSDRFHTTTEYIVNRCNVYGSGLGLGHPLGATGARITTTLAHIINNNDCKFGVASLCIGGGMGAALMLRKVDKNEFA